MNDEELLTSGSGRARTADNLLRARLRADRPLTEAAQNSGLSSVASRRRRRRVAFHTLLWFVRASEQK